MRAGYREVGSLDRMRRLALIANPMASGFTAALHRDVMQILGRTHDVTAVWPTGPGEARAAAARAASEQYDVVAAMGGDGVAHQAANGVLGTPTALGVVPAGTTNVLRRILHLPPKARDAAEAIAEAEGSRPLRVAAVTGDERLDDRHFVATFAVGIGLDAEIIRESERRPLRKVGFGALHYARSATKVAVSGHRHRLPYLRVRSGNRWADAVAVLVQVHDTLTYLGRYPLRVGSGSGLTAVVVERATPTRLIRVVAGALRGGDVSRIRGVHVWQDIDSISVDADPPGWFEADGELLGTTTTLQVEASPHRLLVVDTVSR